MKTMKNKSPEKNFFGKPLNNICVMKIISMDKIYLKEKKIKRFENEKCIE